MTPRSTLSRWLLAAVPTIAASAAVPAQAEQFEPFGEIRGYPSGVIFTGGLGLPLSNNYYGSLHAGYNVAERGNNGEFDDESGGGFGFGGTVDRYFGPNQTGWFAGGRLELFFLEIDYRGPGSGTSDITVFQPTVRGGYAWRFGNSGQYGVQLAVSAGAEINVATSGPEVGEGAIVLGGVSFTFKP